MRTIIHPRMKMQYTPINTNVTSITLLFKSNYLLTQVGHIIRFNDCIQAGNILRNYGRWGQLCVELQATSPLKAQFKTGIRC